MPRCIIGLRTIGAFLMAARCITGRRAIAGLAMGRFAIAGFRAIAGLATEGFAIAGFWGVAAGPVGEGAMVAAGPVGDGAVADGPVGDGVTGAAGGGVCARALVAPIARNRQPAISFLMVVILWSFDTSFGPPGLRTPEKGLRPRRSSHALNGL